MRLSTSVHWGGGGGGGQPMTPRSYDSHMTTLAHRGEDENLGFGLLLMDLPQSSRDATHLAGGVVLAAKRGSHFPSALSRGHTCTADTLASDSEEGKRGR